MTQTVAWRSYQPIGDRPWWGADGTPPFLEVTDATDARLSDAPDEVPSERAVPALPTEARA